MLNLRKSMAIVLAKDSSPAQVYGAVAEWAAAGFVCCLVLGMLDSKSGPEVGLIAGVATATVVSVVLLLLRRYLAGRV